MPSENSREIEGLVDTNVFLHAQTTDTHSLECRALLRALESGETQARLEISVRHDLTYALPRYVKQFGRQETGHYLRQVIAWPGIIAEKQLLSDSMQR